MTSPSLTAMERLCLHSLKERLESVYAGHCPLCLDKALTAAREAGREAGLQEAMELVADYWSDKYDEYASEAIRSRLASGGGGK